MRSSGSDLYFWILCVRPQDACDATEGRLFVQPSHGHRLKHHPFTNIMRVLCLHGRGSNNEVRVVEHLGDLSANIDLDLPAPNSSLPS